MAHIIYISPEEEITSLISRLRRFPKNDLILVIPQRALILESIINLQLLKKELDAIEKHFVVVTQDKRGGSSAKRVGIEVYSKSYLEAIQKQQGNYEKESFDLERYPNGEERINISQKDEKSILLEEQGEYAKMFSSDKVSSGTRKGNRPITDGIRSIADVRLEKRKNRGSEEKNTYGEEIELAMREKEVVEIREEGHKNLYRQSVSLENKGKFSKDIPPEQHFSYNKEPNKTPFYEKEKKIKKDFVFSFRTFFFTLLFFGVMIFSSFLLLRYLPNANVRVVMETVEIDGDVEVSTTSSGEGEDLSIKIFTENITFTEMFSSTGREVSDTRRATGIVTLYNTFSADPQPLVATTRLLSETGKVYRLTKSVVIPGKKNENGIDTPGKIQVEVKADEPGETYNIEASRFTIPGFEGSPKYEAFYAQSEEAFIGGGGSSSEIAVVAEKDIENARKRMEEIAKQRAQETISSALSEDWILIEDTWDIVMENADAFPGIGSVAEKFEYSVVAKVRVMSWQKSALEDVIKKKLFATLSEKGKDFKSEQWLLETIDIQYGKATPNFEEESLQFKTFSSLKGRFILEEDAFKKDILGKTIPEVNLISQKYSGIREIFIERKPSEPLWLFSRISSLDSRVTLEVE